MVDFQTHSAMAFIRPEIARLTLTYLERENYLRTFEIFREECPFLVEFRNMLPRYPNSENSGSFLGFSLLDVFEDYNRCISLVQTRLHKNGLDLQRGDNLSTALERALSSCKCSKETLPATFSGYVPNQFPENPTSKVISFARADTTRATASGTSYSGVRHYQHIPNLRTQAVLNNNYVMRNDSDRCATTLTQVNTVVIPQRQYDFGQPRFSNPPTQAIEYHPSINDQSSFPASHTALVGASADTALVRINSAPGHETRFFQPQQLSNLTAQTFQGQNSVRALPTFEGQPVFTTSVASIVGMDYNQIQPGQVVQSPQFNQAQQPYAYQPSVKSNNLVPPLSTWIMEMTATQIQHYQNVQHQQLFNGAQQTNGYLPLQDINHKIPSNVYDTGSTLSSGQAVVSTQEHPAAQFAGKPVSVVNESAAKPSPKRKCNEVSGSEDIRRKCVRIAPKGSHGPLSITPVTSAYIPVAAVAETVFHKHVPWEVPTAQLYLTSNSLLCPASIPNPERPSNTTLINITPTLTLQSVTITTPPSVATQSNQDGSSSFGMEAIEGIAGKLSQHLSPLISLPYSVPLPIANVVSVCNASPYSRAPESLQVNSLPAADVPNLATQPVSDISSSTYEVPVIHASLIASDSERTNTCEVKRVENPESCVVLEVPARNEQNKSSTSVGNAAFSDISKSLPNADDSKLERYFPSLKSLAAVPLSRTEEQETSSDALMLSELLETISNIQNTQEMDLVNAPILASLLTPNTHVPSSNGVPENRAQSTASPERNSTLKLKSLEDGKINGISKVGALSDTKSNGKKTEQTIIPENSVRSENPSDNPSGSGLPCLEPIPCSSTENPENSSDRRLAKQKLIQMSDEEWKQLRKLMARPHVILKKIPATWESEIRENGCVILNLRTRKNRRKRKMY